MNKWKKRIAFLLSMIVLSGCMTGCTLISSGDDLLQAPRSSERFMKLQQQLSDIMGDKLTYVSPQSGSYRNSVTFEDLDKDGTEEAIAFLREGSGGSVFLYIFKLQDDEYEQIGHIEGPGSTLGAMSFLQMEDRELILLTWTMSGDVKQGLTVCGVQNDSVTELLDATYTSYAVCNMDDDSADELFTVSYDDSGRKTAQIYGYSGNKMVLISQTDATQEVQTVANIETGRLKKGKNQAVFVDNRFENDNGMQTDIYVMENNKLRNLALSTNASTYRSVSLYYCTDVDEDGVVEVPQLRAMPGYDSAASDREEDTSYSTDVQWMVDWYQYNEDGTTVRKRTTYENLAEGWRMRLPDKWRGNVTASSVSDIGINQTIFVNTHDDNAGEPLLTVYVFTGEDRKQKASAANLIVLGETSDSCFAAKLSSEKSQYALSETEIIHLFEIIQSEWNS